MQRENLRICAAIVFFFLFAPLGGELAIAGHIAVWGQLSPAPSGNEFVAIAGGGGVYGNHAIALTADGSLAAWGYNGYGQCNVPSGNDFVAIAAGEFYSLALRSDGSLVAWGANEGDGWEYYGQCNVPSGNDFVAISCGYRHGLAIKSDGSLAAWGRNDYDQCNVPAGNDFVAVAAGMMHSLALRADGSLTAWGYNNEGVCDVPVGNDFVAIASGVYFNLALRSDGSLVAWGENSDGQCDVPAGNDFAHIGCGSRHALAAKADRSLVAWGDNGYGQCNFPPGNKYTEVAGGDNASLALILEPPRRYYVDVDAVGKNDGSSWADAFTYLQDVLAVASSSDEVWVAEGVYAPDRDTANPDGSGDRNAAFRPTSGLALRGGYAGFGEPDPNARDISFYRTILSGDLNGDDGPGFGNNGDNSYHVVVCNGVSSASSLEGFIITGGNADYGTGGAGGGIHCTRSNPKIINCMLLEIVRGRGGHTVADCSTGHTAARR